MKSFFQRFIIWIGPLLPFFLRHLFYLFPLFKLKSFLYLLGMQAWARNSVYFKEEVFGLSDLDITIYAPQGLAPGSLKKRMITYYLKLLRIFFPFVGEVVIYDDRSIRDYLPLASAIELRRDPLLLKRVGGENSYHDLRQAFILNWIFNDYHRMDQSILQRRNKVDRFRNLLAMESKSFFSAEDLLMDLLKDFDFLKGEDKRAQWFEALQHFLRAYRINQTPINEWLRDHRAYEEVIALCYPQIWMGAAIHNDSFYDTLHRLKGRGREEKEILAQQISWELWGLYSNSIMTAFSAEIALHLDHLKDCACEVLADHSLLESIEKLRGLYERD